MDVNGCGHSGFRRWRHARSWIIYGAVSGMGIPDAMADPWFSGGLIFDSAEVAEVGSHNVEFDFQSSNMPSIYDYSGMVVPTPLASSDYLLLQYATGLTVNTDIGVAMLYTKNQTEGASRSGLGDTLIEFGYQVLEQGNSQFRPNFRIAVSEIFPTGRYAQLNTSLYGTDSLGEGSYQTSVTLAFDLLSQLKGTAHYFKTSISGTATIPSKAHLNGNNAYGGDVETEGYITPGNAFAFDLAVEYSLTQNWVAVYEMFVFAQAQSVFSGILGPNPSSFNAFITQAIVANSPSSTPEARHNSAIQARLSNHIRPTGVNIGSAQDIGFGNMNEFSLSPALEYNFSENMGVTLGLWFTVTGKNMPNFTESMFRFTVSW